MGRKRAMGKLCKGIKVGGKKLEVGKKKKWRHVKGGEKIET